MKIRKNKILVIAVIATLTFTTGCAITTTRNNYYIYPDQSVKTSVKNEAISNYSVDTLTNNWNGKK